MKHYFMGVAVLFGAVSVPNSDYPSKEAVSGAGVEIYLKEFLTEVQVLPWVFPKFLIISIVSVQEEFLS